MKNAMLICMIMALLGSSCKKEKEESHCTISIELPSKASDIEDVYETGDKYFDSIEYIQLQSTENLTLGEIDKLIITDDRIYILDIFKYGGVIVFDREGRVINTINKFGQGPNEYNYLFGFFYDNQDNTLNLLCRYPNKIMKFDKDGNDLINQFSLSEALLDIKKSKDGYYVGYAGSSSINNSHSIYILSEKFEFVKSEFPNNKGWNRYRLENKLSTYNDSIYFAPEYGYTVYRENEQGIYPLYTYDFGKHGISKNIFNNHEEFSKLDRESLIDCIEKFQETDNYLISTFIFQGSTLVSFFSKKDNVSNTFLALSNPISELDFGKIITLNEHYLVTSIDAATVVRILEDPEITKRLSKGVNMLKNSIKRPISEFDDPILCIYHINP